MSIVDVLRSVDELAKAINEKSQELTRLKTQYSEKLLLLNTYVDHLPVTSDSINDDELLEQINKDVKCENCSHTVWSNLNKDSKFVVLPKGVVRNPNLNIGKDQSTNYTIRHEDTMQNTNKETYNTTHNNPKNKKFFNKSKKICSYCKKPGHSRSKCFVRLSKES